MSRDQAGIEHLIDQPSFFAWSLSGSSTALDCHRIAGHSNVFMIRYNEIGDARKGLTAKKGLKWGQSRQCTSDRSRNLRRIKHASKLHEASEA